MYDTGRYEVKMVTRAGSLVLDLTATGRIGWWGPEFVTHILRAVAVNLNATPGDAGILLVELNPTYNSATNTVTVTTINLATTHTYTAGSQARVVYKDGLSQIVYPGQEFALNVSDASASVNAARVSLWVEAVYERPANMPSASGVIATT